LAAGFNTPIAGVLFVIEELMRDISGLTLETAIAASFTGAVISRFFNTTDLNLPTALLDATRRGSFTPAEIPFYLLLGFLAGILGGIFNRCIIRGMKFNRNLAIPRPLKIGLAGLISGIVVAFLPPFFMDNAGLREFLIAGELSWQLTALVFVAQFFLAIVAYSSGAPGGLFSPALVLGSALGYIVGTFEVTLLGTESPYTFALAGMGAFFTAVVRVPVTSIVIIFEMTADFNLVLPLMIVSATAYIVAESVSAGSLYEHLLGASGIEITEEHPHHDFLSELTADDVMESKVQTLSSNLTLSELIKAMSRSHHRGFPVVEGDRLVGIVTQSDIPKDSQKSGSMLLRDIMTPCPIVVNPTTSIADVLFLLNRYQLSRLPVTEGNKLLGIITRSDIIKAEAQQLNRDRRVTIKSEPAYVVYRTRSPATGKGRILLPLANLENVSGLMKLALAIAKERKYEIECLHIVPVPRYIHPAQAKVNTGSSRKLMRQMERWGRKEKIPVHTKVCLANDIVEAVLETVAKEHIDLLLMGFKGKTANPEQVFGSVTDSLISQAACDLLLVKLGDADSHFPLHFNERPKWLLPTAGGKNIQKATALLPGLANLYPNPKTLTIELCQVFFPDKVKPNGKNIQQIGDRLQSKIGLKIRPLVIRSHSVSEAIIKLNQAANYDLIILGASNEGLLQHAVKGNIPKAIARDSTSTVIIFRSSL
ncbi:chloride channel protein, partial [Myxosarcina sp. GI1]|uniref:chloride channel protein n=1 Tax=Myxosarcina sp. GI1 TaxID=1541065 RepID=UPI00055D63A4